MLDLNDLHHFAQVVDRGGFATRHWLRSPSMSDERGRD
jgi:hypothetical protein